jgi:hypothetical protein
MKKILAMCGVLLALSASAALAQINGGLDITWTTCVLEGSLQDQNFTNCTTSGAATSTRRLYSVLKSPVNLPNFVAVQCVYDLQQEGVPNVDPYWRFDAVCNQSGLTIQSDPDPAGAGTCDGETNPWGLGGADGSPFIVLSTPTGNRTRIITATTRASTNPFPILGDGITNYYISTLLFNTSNRATCPGCNNKVAIVWNDAEMAENTGNRVHITGPDKVGNCVTMNARGTPTDNICQATPARKTTWGQLKSIYR